MQVMKKIVYLFLSAATVINLLGCNNKLNILAPYKDVTVVYGLMDQSDTVHYIRVNRAYQTSGNAITAAAQYDSINYPVGTLTVQLQDWNNGSLVGTITLDTTTGINLNAGIFSYPKQVLYYTKQVLNPNDQYNLLITNVKTNKVITGSTTLLPDVNVTVAGFSDFLDNFPIDITNGVQYPTYIQWTSGIATIYQLNMQFYYNSIDSVNKDTSLQYINWGFPEHVSSQSGTVMSDAITCLGFQELIKTSFQPVPLGSPIKRVPLYMKVQFTSGSLDLNTYIQLSQPSLGINQDKPFYSDVTNGVGIYTARHTQTAIKPLDISTKDSIINGTIDRGLNFEFQ
jgi:hypothetical protein